MFINNIKKRLSVIENHEYGYMLIKALAFPGAFQSYDILVAESGQPALYAGGSIRGWALPKDNPRLGLEDFFQRVLKSVGPGEIEDSEAGWEKVQ